VTQAEILLYGGLASTVRLLGQAATAASDSFSIACKKRAGFDDISEEEMSDPLRAQIEALDTAVQQTWAAYQHARHAYAVVAGDALTRQREDAKSAGLIVLPSQENSSTTRLDSAAIAQAEAAARGKVSLTYPPPQAA